MSNHQLSAPAQQVGQVPTPTPTGYRSGLSGGVHDATSFSNRRAYFKRLGPFEHTLPLRPDTAADAYTRRHAVCRRPPLLLPFKNHLVPTKLTRKTHSKRHETRKRKSRNSRKRNAPPPTRNAGQ